MSSFHPTNPVDVYPLVHQKMEFWQIAVCITVVDPSMRHKKDWLLRQLEGKSERWLTRLSPVRITQGVVFYLTTPCLLWHLFVVEAPRHRQLDSL